MALVHTHQFLFLTRFQATDTQSAMIFVKVTGIVLGWLVQMAKAFGSVLTTFAVTALLTNSITIIVCYLLFVIAKLLYAADEIQFEKSSFSKATMISQNVFTIVATVKFRND